MKKIIPGKQTYGVITEDPAKDFPVGSALKFYAAYLEHDFKEKSQWLSNWEVFNGMVLLMHFGTTEKYSIEGTAVMVGPGIALCASHVIEPHLQSLVDEKIGVICAGITLHGMQLWRVHKVTPVINSDLTILGLVMASALPPDNKFPISMISTRTPGIGEKMVISGFRASQKEFNPSSKGGGEFSGRLLACIGDIKTIYPKGRDAALMPWPTIEIECPTWGGMSGGPAFDVNGKLIGLLSTSLQSEDDNGPSYVSLVWPALSAEFEGGWPLPAFQEKQTLVGLHQGACFIDKREAIEILYDEENKRAGIKYHPWT